jgi:hypothetical protein
VSPLTPPASGRSSRPQPRPELRPAVRGRQVPDPGPGSYFRAAQVAEVRLADAQLMGNRSDRPTRRPHQRDRTSLKSRRELPALLSHRDTRPARHSLAGRVSTIRGRLSPSATRRFRKFEVVPPGCSRPPGCLACRGVSGPLGFMIYELASRTTQQAAD